MSCRSVLVKAVCVILVVFMMKISNGSTVNKGINKNKDNNEYCNIPETGPMKKGEIKPWIKDGCSEATCTDDGTVRLVHCTKRQIYGNCTHMERTPTWEEVKHKPYPECCIDECIPEIHVENPGVSVGPWQPMIIN